MAIIASGEPVQNSITESSITRPLRLRVIACNVFWRELCWCAARSPNLLDIEFTELGEHAQPQCLRDQLQERIAVAEKTGKNYDAILLAFGLCGNATVGLRAMQTPLILPRAHDCATLLLGSRAAFKDNFADNPSRGFSSSGYLERGDYFLSSDESGTRVHAGDVYATYVEQYGEENARYLMDTLHAAHADGDDGRALFIETAETRSAAALERFREKAGAAGRTVQVLQGNLRLIRMLLDGEWTDEEFLTVQAGQAIAGIYDWDRIVKAVS